MSATDILHNEHQLTDQGKDTNEFRVYKTEFEQNGDHISQRVRDHYLAQHKNQTVEFAHKMHDKWLHFNHAEMDILECLQLLDNWIDQSDPDIDAANIVHAYQTAERLRELYPDKDWLHLTGLVHDLGKVMAVWGEEAWATTGDTYPLGCRPVPSVVFRNTTFDQNPDIHHPTYSTELGMYRKHCGLSKLLMSWGHDEYMYRVLKNHADCRLPDEGLFSIRFHSFYPWHTAGHYKQFEDVSDRQMMPTLMQLNRCDLYSKSDQEPDIASLKSYYGMLVHKYIPGLVRW